MKLFQVFVVIFFVAATSCKKEVKLPHPELNQLFGKWEWLYSTGGFSGYTDSVTVGYTQSVEFDSKGLYTLYENGKVVFVMKYKINERSSSLSTEVESWLQFENRGIFKKNHAVPDLRVRIFHSDTIFLDEEFADGYSYCYVRK